MLHSKLACALHEFVTDKEKKLTKLTQAKYKSGKVPCERKLWKLMLEMQGRELVPQKFFQDAFLKIFFKKINHRNNYFCILNILANHAKSYHETA